MDQAHAFFVDVIGCEHVYTIPTIASADDWMATHLNVHPRSVIREVRFFRCGFGSNFELFAYETPEGQAPPPRNSDIGGHHLAFYVDDLDGAVAYLRHAGVTVLGSPTASSGPSLGQRFVYFLAPWGMQLELVSFPQGKDYESGAGRLLWSPVCPGA